MRFWGYVLAASLAIAVLQRLVAILLIAFVLAILWGVFFRPAVTFGLLFFGLITNLLKWNAWAGVAMLALLMILARLGEKREAAVRDCPPLTESEEVSEKGS